MWLLAIGTLILGYYYYGGKEQKNIELVPDKDCSDKVTEWLNSVKNNPKKTVADGQKDYDLIRKVLMTDDGLEMVAVEMDKNSHPDLAICLRSFKGLGSNIFG